MTKILEPTALNIDKCIEILKKNQIIAIPTETVYGLAGLAQSDEAVSKIFEVKDRPQFNPLISHYASMDQLSRDALLNDLAIKLYEAFCPGPLTLVLNKTKNSRISRLACAGLETAAVRFPSHEITRNLLQKLNEPLVAPSANPSGRVSPVTAEQVKNMLNKKIDFILDGGRCEIGLESTIIDLSLDEPVILRFGAITKEMLENVLGTPVSTYSTSQIKSPGMMFQHYSPKCGLRLGTSPQNPNEVLLTFGQIKYEKGFKVVKNLSPSGNMIEAAKNLFNYLHEFDSMDISGIAAVLVPDEGIGKAINDRLKRAAGIVYSST